MAQSPAEKGIALYRSGQNEEAMPLLRQAVEEEPTRADLHMYLGMCWGKRDKWADAVREFEKACDLDGASAEYPFYAGVAMVKLGRLREANSMFHVALLNNPNHAKAQAAFEQTKAAAAQVTTDGSSAVMPGGLGSIDILNLEMDLPGKKQASSDPLAGALSELKQQQSGGAKATAKKSGCGGGILVGLATIATFAWLLFTLV
ncbi:MAG: tetratricopeptide repeat protein [Armatimonadetes bacterium]|nr:tetratricopeptide repeat protein [Armatimonadota bacterium]